MYKNRKKYRTIVYLLSLFYVSFFFLSPHVHHHHSDSEDSHSHPHSAISEKSEIIHTHLFNDSDKLHSKESDSHQHQYSETDYSSDLFKINNGYRLKTFRDIQSFPNFDFCTIIEYSIIEEDVALKSRPTTTDFSKLQWDKYVQSATNLSPPLRYNI